VNAAEGDDEWELSRLKGRMVRMIRAFRRVFVQIIRVM